jgi:hypothetical protein
MWCHLKVNRRFGGACRLHLHDRKISQARNQRETELRLPSAYSKTSVGFQRTIRRHIFISEKTPNPAVTRLGLIQRSRASAFWVPTVFLLFWGGGGYIAMLLAARLHSVEC